MDFFLIYELRLFVDSKVVSLIRFIDRYVGWVGENEFRVHDPAGLASDVLQVYFKVILISCYVVCVCVCVCARARAMW